MPLISGSSDRKLIVITLTAFALLTLFAAVFASPAGQEGRTPPTTYSSASGGAKAAYLLMKESGWKVDRWERSPEELRKSGDAVYILAEPLQLPSDNERAAILDFVNQGGTLVVTGPVAERIFPGSGVRTGMPQYTWSTEKALAPSPFNQAPEITIRANASWDASRGPYVPLYGPDDENAVAVEVSQGNGEIIWWSEATPLTNSGITEPGNLDFVLACAGGGRRAVLFDEYFHGHRVGQTLSDTSRALWWLLAQAGLLAVAVVLTFSRRSGPVQMPRTESRLSPLEFVETLGGLYERASATRVPIEVAHQQFRYRLTRKLGLPINASVETIAESAAERLNYRNSTLAQVLRRCEMARGQTPTSSESLEIVRTLRELEREMQLSIRRAPKQTKEG